MKAGDKVYIGREELTVVAEPSNFKVPLIDARGQYRLIKAASVKPIPANRIKAWWNGPSLIIRQEMTDDAGAIDQTTVTVPPEAIEHLRQVMEKKATSAPTE
jgi:hypothetical protein